MARITVEDSIVKVPNRFELVLVSAQRARDLGTGATITIDRDNDKNTVVALREIADGTLDLNELKNRLISSQQKVQTVFDTIEEDVELQDIQAELATAEEAEELIKAGMMGEEGTEA